MEYDVAIVGGGISGLVSAHSLTKSGFKIVLFDGEELGGVVQTKMVDGNHLELGPNTLLGTPTLFQLFEELNISDKVIDLPLNLKRYVWYQGKLHLIPSNPAALLKSNLFGVLDKIKILRGMFKTLPPDASKDDLSVAKFFGYFFPERVNEALIDSAFRGIFGGDIAKLHAPSVMPKLFEFLSQGGTFFQYAKAGKAVGRRRICGISGGMRVLVSALNDRLKDRVVIEKQQVKEISKDASLEGFKIMDGANNTHLARSVILATSGAKSGSFLKDIEPTLSKKLCEVESIPLGVCHFSCRRSFVPSKSFGVLFASSSKLNTLGILFNTEIFPDNFSGEEACVTVCFGGKSSERFMSSPGEVIEETIRREIKETLAIELGALLSLCSWPSVIPQYELNYPEVFEAIQAAEASSPGLAFVGADYGGVSVPNRVDAAVSGATRIEQHLRGSLESVRQAV